jgi:glycosyltransferase involved in cell wall biosynthesis
MRPLVSIGVPIYRGERFLAETLHCIEAQTYRDFCVLMSLDGPDPACEVICRPFLDDSRFRLVVQPRRLGWVGHFNWLLSQAEGDFWYYHQQDDLTDPVYVEVLVDHALRNGSAALVYCDVAPFGRVTKAFEQVPSVLGTTPFIRLMTMLHEHLVAFAFRGLTRVTAIRQAGPAPTNAVDDFGADISWLAAIARCGELHRVPMPLYRKRYHDKNTETKWWNWPRQRKLEAWTHHCVDMLNQALYVEGSVAEMRLIWLAALERLTSPATARTFVPLADLSADERRMMLEGFLAGIPSSSVHDVPALLDASWHDIAEWTHALYWMPNEAPLEIIGFGPQPVEADRPFNVQCDGSSAVWVRASRHIRHGSQIRLGDVVLGSTLRGALATAPVPASMILRAGKYPLVLVGCDGRARSNAVVFEIAAAGLSRVGSSPAD